MGLRREEGLLLHEVESRIATVSLRILLERLAVKAFEANQLNSDGLLFLVVLSNVDTGFVESSVGDAHLLSVVESLENLVGDLRNYVFG